MSFSPRKFSLLPRVELTSISLVTAFMAALKEENTRIGHGTSGFPIVITPNLGVSICILGRFDVRLLRHDANKLSIFIYHSQSRMAVIP